MSEHDDLIRDVRAAAKAAYLSTNTWVAEEIAPLLNEAADALEARPSLVVRGEEELVCDVCGRDYPIWFAPDEVWNLGSGERPGFECPSCFAVKYETHVGRPVVWKFAPEGHPSLVAESREAVLAHVVRIFHGTEDDVEFSAGHDINPVFCDECPRVADALLAPGGPVRLADAIRAEVIAWIADGDSTPSIRRSVKNAREHFGLDGFTRRETGQ